MNSIKPTSPVPARRRNRHPQSSKARFQFPTPGFLVLELRFTSSSSFSTVFRGFSYFIEVRDHLVMIKSCVGTAYQTALSKTLSLVFDEKFIRPWEYYFDYCATGFKTRTL
ncbi:hypothetical protein SOVF_044210, partial [Spinacia oleracea]